jgi:hypothetical protein
MDSTEPPHEASAANKQDDQSHVEYLVNKQEMTRFIRLMFGKVKPIGGIKLSAFLENKDEDPKDSGKHVWVHLHKDGLDGLIKKATELAYQSANDDPPRVFCPPPAIFRKGLGATMAGLQTCPALFVDCDAHPAAAQQTLEALLGAASIVVHSGGEWLDEETCGIEAKRHLYWLLREPAEGDEINKLGAAQKIATALIDGDTTMTLCHPLRWPGGLHRKREARQCRIESFSSAGYDLDELYEILIKAIDEAPAEVKERLTKTKGRGKAKANGNANDPFALEDEIDDRTPEQRADEWGELFEAVYVGTELHDPINRIAMKLVKLGVDDDRAVRNILEGLMRRTQEKDRDNRWKARFADIERSIATARVKIDAEKEAEETAQAKQQAGIQPLDLWGYFAPPALPRGIVPKVIENFAFVEGEQMGADRAGLALGALTVCAAAITDELMIQVKQHSRGWIERPILWVGLLGGPSERKSPIMNAVERPLKAIDTRLMHDYLAAKAAYAALSKEEREVREEPRRERLRLEDTTIEACQDAQRYNPRGMLSSQDELSGWFGSMDKYGSGGKGAGKDRGFVLQTWNGGSCNVDRISRGSFTIPNIGLSVLGGVQDSVIRKLAGEVYDDGLIQRLLPIVLRPATESKDEPTPQAVEDYHELIEQLCRLTVAAVDVDPFAEVSGNCMLMFDEAAQKVRQQAERKHREMVQTFTGLNKRLASHIGKYDGYFARLSLVFHVVENVGAVRLAGIKLPGVTPPG